MRGLTNQCGVGRGAANGLPEPYRQKTADRTSEYCDVACRAAGPIVDTARKVVLNTLYAGISQACYKPSCVRVSPHEKRSEVPGRIPNRSSGMRSVGRSRSLRGSSESYDSLRNSMAPSSGRSQTGILSIHRRFSTAQKVTAAFRPPHPSPDWDRLKAT